MPPSMLIENATDERSVNTTVGESPRNPPLTVVDLLPDFPNIFLVSLALVLASTSGMLAYVLLKALVKVQRAVLKSKYLVMNAILTDVLLPVTYSIFIVPYIAKAYGMPNNYTRVCLDGLAALFAPTAQFAQILAFLALAGDRMYAVTFPFVYHSWNYPRCVSVLILSATWIIPLGITAFTMFNPVNGNLAPGLCYRIAPGNKILNKLIRFPFTFVVSLITFCIYIAMFFVVKSQRRRFSSKTRDDKERVSLTISYFLLHLTSFCLYLPGPLFALLQEFGYLRLDVATMLQIRRGFILLYMLNPIIDCTMLATRVSAIRERIFLPFKRRRKASLSQENVTSDTKF